MRGFGRARLAGESACPTIGEVRMDRVEEPPRPSANPPGLGQARRPVLRSRELQVDLEARVGVGRADGSAVEFDGAAGDGEAQPDAAAEAVAV